MGHIADGMLRRLDDEPLAVPDRVSEHLSACGRCRARHARVTCDRERAARLLSSPRLVPDTDAAWDRLRRELRRGSDERADRRWESTPVLRRRRPFPTVSLRAGLLMGALGIVVAGTAAAASLTTIFQPTHVAPVSVSQSDVRAITALVGLGDNRLGGGLPGPNGSTAFRFGTIRWSSAGSARPASSLSDAAAQAGFRIALPARLPRGVGAVRQLMVQPGVSATVTFGASAAGLAGSSLTLDARPAVLAEYGAVGATDVPTLAVVAMPRPTALSNGATLSQIEAFLLRQPGVPPELAEEVRLLGDLRTILPVPVPPGAAVHSVRVAGSPGVLLADSSNAAAAVVWEDGHGMVHVVAGILDPKDVLNVADQLG